MAITSVKIFPPIGIARLGNSPSGYTVGPEIPGVFPAPPYKDEQCRIKRQATRFRVWGYDAQGAPVGELTGADATISWTVHLANTKGSWRFEQTPGTPPPARTTSRNSGIPDVQVEIDPGPRTLAGPNQAPGFNTGSFLGLEVSLGEMRTDADSRLLVLGGFGQSGSVPDGLGITHFANNSGWYDDVSDGPVSATVTLNGTTTPLIAAPAWVICPPPRLAPPLDSASTLYDVLYQVAVNKLWLTIPASTSFSRAIYLILRRPLWLAAARE